MEQYAEHETEFRKYLLGELVPDDALRVEARLFLEDEYAQLLKAAEHDLLDEYVSGELAGEERERFERHFLSDPARQDDHMLARALKRYIEGEAPADAAVEEGHQGLVPPVPAGWRSFLFPPGRRDWLKLAAAFAFIFVVACGAWFIFNSLRRPAPPESARIQEQPTPRAADPERRGATPAGEENGERQNPTPTPSPGGTPEPTPGGRRHEPPPRPSPGEARSLPGALAVMLIPGAPVREDSRTKEVTIPPRGGTLSLRLPLLGKPGHSRYEATLYAEDGRVLHDWTALRPIASKPVAYVVVAAPAHLLTPQYYQVKLRAVLPDGGTRNVSSYHFRALNK
jgi:anti-sigma factor RsiW